MVELLAEANKSLQDRFTLVQEENKRKAAEYEMLSEDMEYLVSEKAKQDEAYEKLNQELDRLKSSQTLDSDLLDRKMAEMREEFEVEKEKEMNVLKLAREEYEQVKAKAIEENKKLVNEKFQEERTNLQQLMDTEKKDFQQSLENSFQERISELETQLQEVSTRERELEISRQEEELMRKQATQQVALLSEELHMNQNRLQQQIATHEDSENEAIHQLQHQLKAAVAAQQEAIEGKECEKLLKEQYLRETETLRNELDASAHSDSTEKEDLAQKLEEMKQHKDVIIKKLKVKVKHEIAEKEKLNKSLSEALNTSTTVNDIREQCDNLEKALCVKAEELHQAMNESSRMLDEKEDLITSLKDDNTILKDTLNPLMTKADNVINENHDLKHQLQTVQDEVTHLREHTALKDDELTDIIEQEKNLREEYNTKMEKFKQLFEEKENTIKSLKDELQWMQSQVDDLAPKSERLDETLNEVSSLKEMLHEQTKIKSSLEQQLRNTESNGSDKDEVINSLNAHCSQLQEQLESVLAGKEDAEIMMSQISEQKEIEEQRKEEIQHLKDALQTRESQLEDTKNTLIDKDNQVNELQGVLQTLEVELEQTRSSMDRSSEELELRDNQIETAKNLLAAKEQELNALQHSLDAVQDLEKALEMKENELESSRQSLVEYDKLSTENEILKQQIKDLIKAIDEARQDGTQTNDNETIAQIEELTAKNLKVQNRCDQVEATYQNLLNQYEVQQRQHEAEIQRVHEQITDLEGALNDERTKGDISMNESTRTIEELQQLRNFLQGQEKDKEDLTKQNNQLKTQMEQMKSEYQTSIHQLQESLDEKEALYEESVTQIQYVKNMLEQETRSNISTPVSAHPPAMNFNENVESEIPLRASIFGDETFEKPIQVSTIDELESASTWEESGWDDENVLPESEQPQPSVAVNVEALNEELRTLREQMEVAQQQQQALQLEKDEQKQHKDTVIAKLKGKLRATIAERNQLKEQPSATSQPQEDLREELESSTHKLQEALSEIDELKEKLANTVQSSASDQDIDELRNEMDAVKTRKDEVIAKLKLKLKQTIRLKENLQVEVERVSADKDVVFNEFSDKMQQQNRESDQLKQDNYELNQSLNTLQSQIANKARETDSLTESFNKKAAVVKDMAVDMDDLRAKHAALMKENQQLMEEAASKEQELTEKLEWESSEKDDHISDLEKEIKSLRDGKEEWDEVRKTLEEALQIKDDAVSKVKEQLDNLHREHAKLNAQTQSNAHKTQENVEEYIEKIKSLEEQCTAEKKAKEDERIKSVDVQTQLEAVEILFGLSDNDDLSLAERLSNWKQQTVDEYKSLERAHKEGEFERGDVQRGIAQLEKVLDIASDPRLLTNSRVEEITRRVVDRQKDVQQHPKQDEVQEEILTLKTENSKLSEKMNDTLHTLEAKTNELKELNTKLANSSTELENVTQQLADKSSENHDLSEEIQELTDEVSDLREQLEDVFTLQKTGDKNDDGVMTSDQFTMEALNESAKKFQQKLTKQGTEIADLKNVILASNSQLREKDHMITLKEDRIISLLEDVNKVKTKVEESVMRAEEMSALNEELEKEKQRNQVMFALYLSTSSTFLCLKSLQR